MGLRSGSRHLTLIIFYNAVVIPWQEKVGFGVQKCGFKAAVVKLPAGWEMWAVCCCFGGGSVGCVTQPGCAGRSWSRGSGEEGANFSP